MHEEAARVDVHNAIISQDPTTLDGSLVQEMSRRYGLNLVKRLSPQLCAFYDRYLESCIPKGEASLTGKEASKLVAFKSALGISDEDAALVHMDVGRRLSRSTFESDTRTERSTSRKVRLRKKKSMGLGTYISLGFPIVDISVLPGVRREKSCFPTTPTPRFRPVTGADLSGNPRKCKGRFSAEDGRDGKRSSNGSGIFGETATDAVIESVKR